ncbi:hypothetical protein HYPSUDRAFT_169232 [Hypholoma sublateritium FD-334 SS-4]|uniref:Transposase Tc1-like domain-containing protein n=1 Tax=Hypholoma sublateritium (strain FD-334 SS-4) TaxID=945553 RepID=A0A0D2KUN5_HYPSF|nr:hypothetical protein HYPSUDRAFT_169232 [Hypholoma sublateritium FD-334 SS-4]
MSNNPTGINGHKDCPPKADAQIEALIRNYHRNGVTNRASVSRLLRVEHNVKMGEATVARRFKAFGLVCHANKTTQQRTKVKDEEE